MHRHRTLFTPIDWQFQRPPAAHRAMSRLPVPLLPVVAFMVAGMACPLTAQINPVLDQSQTGHFSSTDVQSDLPKAQTFTAGYYGQIDRVRVLIENYSIDPPATAYLTVSIQTVIAGLPSGQQIGSGVIASSAIPALGSPDWVEVSIRNGGLMVPSRQYAVVLQPSGMGAGVKWWFGSNNYAKGAFLVNGGTGWTVTDGLDFTFQTYVIPDFLDQQVLHGSGEGGYTARTMAQIFTAARTGLLDRVRVYLTKTDYPLRVTIQPAINGHPFPVVIGRGEIPAGILPGALYSGWCTVAIDGAPVTALNQYALVIEQQAGEFYWAGMGANGTPFYGGGDMLYRDSRGNWRSTYEPGWTPLYRSAMFETYVVIQPPPTPGLDPPPPPTPCAAGICPGVSGSVNPLDSTARIRAEFRFGQLPSGKVQGILDFDDSQTGDFALRGCNTESAACRLTVTTIACTAERSMTIVGTYTLKGEDARIYRLTASGAKNGIGTFTLSADDSRYSYRVTSHGIVDVICPPAAGAVAGQD